MRLLDVVKNEKDLIKRNSLIAGAILPFYFILVVQLSGYNWASYDSTDRLVSELGSVDSPVRLLVNMLGFGVTGIVIFMVGIIKAKRDKLLIDKVVSALIIVNGLFFVPIAMFNCDSRCVDVTIYGSLHAEFSWAVGVLLPVTALIHGGSLLLQRIHYKVAFGSILTGILSAWGGSLLSDPSIRGNTGISQRIAMAASFMFVALVAASILETDYKKGQSKTAPNKSSKA